MVRQRWLTRRGTSLIEAVIAAGLLAAVLTGVLPLATGVVTSTGAARADLLAAHLARQRLAQLRALTHVRAPSGVIVDTQTRLAADDFASGGAGLSPTGLAPFAASVEGWSDWLDARGAWLSADVPPPPAARYRRRWGILTGSPTDCVRLWVEVSPVPGGVAGRAAHAGAVHCAWGAWP
jgi:type II secretory pathway pseudopilin PulG